MQVKLKVDWFGPNGVLYSRFENPHLDIPDDYKEQLPVGAAWRDNDKDDWTEVKLESDPAPAAVTKGTDNKDGAEKPKL